MTFHKQKIKDYGILVLLLIIAIGSILAANFIAKKIEKQEEAQVILWARAIGEKANVLKLSNDVFLKLANEERKKVEITSKATQFLVSESDLLSERMSFFIDILKLNDQIPVIIADHKLRILEKKNIDQNELKIGEILSQSSHPEFFKYAPIKIKFLTTTQYIYYTDSKIFKEINQILAASSSQFIKEITNNYSQLPVLLLNKDSQVIGSSQVPEKILADSIQFKKYVTEFCANQSPIVIDIDPKNKKYLYYQNSPTVSYIKWFPIALYSILAVLAFLVYLAMSNARNFEKNQIWVGMSKETAHQLGTPISSLTAWLEVLEENKNLPESQLSLIGEMKKDVSRLSLIADRFSKIGSKPKLEQINLSQILNTCYEYLRLRASKKVALSLSDIDPEINLEINQQLFEWVIENLTKNAFDAIPTEGFVKIQVQNLESNIYIDITDSGKGIHSSEFEKIFEPGFTTKKRGWGLGLSLCKRIIEEYFKGKIYVYRSKINKGTTIRIELLRKF